jgi:hypothetical protein
MKFQCSPCGHIFDSYHEGEHGKLCCPSCSTKLEVPAIYGREYLFYCLANTSFKPSMKLSVALFSSIVVSALINEYIFMLMLLSSIVFLAAKATNTKYVLPIICKEAKL